MDPNDSGLYFLRKNEAPHDNEDVGDEEEGGEAGDQTDDLQEQFDEAVAFLVSSGTSSLDQIRDLLRQGVGAQEIIDWYLRESGQAEEEDEEDDGRELDYDEADHRFDDYGDEEDIDGEDDEEYEEGGMPLKTDHTAVAEVLDERQHLNQSAAADDIPASGGEPHDSMFTRRMRGGPPGFAEATKISQHKYDSFDDDDDEE
jgi:hypothetical protein